MLHATCRSPAGATWPPPAGSCCPATRASLPRPVLCATQARLGVDPVGLLRLSAEERREAVQRISNESACAACGRVGLGRMRCGACK